MIETKRRAKSNGKGVENENIKHDGWNGKTGCQIPKIASENPQSSAEREMFEGAIRKTGRFGVNVVSVLGARAPKDERTWIDGYHIIRSAAIRRISDNPRRIDGY